MEFTYSGNPESSDQDAVRFYLGDTDADAPQLSDGEISFLLTDQGTVLAAAVAGAIALAAKYSRLTDESVGDVSKSYSQRAQHFRDLAKNLRTRQSEVGVCPYAGGISIADKEAYEDNTDNVATSFTRDLHNNRQPQRSADDPNYDKY